MKQHVVLAALGIGIGCLTPSLATAGAYSVPMVHAYEMNMNQALQKMENSVEQWRERSQQNAGSNKRQQVGRQINQLEQRISSLRAAIQQYQMRPQRSWQEAKESFDRQLVEIYRVRDQLAARTS